MAKKRKWGPVLAFGAVTAILGGLAAYKHRKEIERTLQEIADQMDAWDGSEEFFHDEDTIVHSVNDTPVEQPDAPQDEAEETAADESDFVDSDDAPPARPGGSSGSLSAYAALCPHRAEGRCIFFLG